MTAGAWIWLVATVVGTPLAVVLWIYYDAVWSEPKVPPRVSSTVTLEPGDEPCWCDDG